jgi:hypothetical protein
MDAIGYGSGRAVRAAALLLGAGLLFGASPCRAQYSGPPSGDQSLNLRPPLPDQLFRITSEQTLRQSIRADAQRAGRTAIFPQEPARPAEVFLGRAWPHQTRYTVPEYVCYGRLLFEQKNFERYGWDLGPVTPFLAAGKFYLDVAALPYHLASDPFRCCECSAGYCSPGDPVPLLLYPCGVSLTGAAAEAAAVAVLLVVFP